MTELDEMIRSLSTGEEVDDLRREQTRRATRARLHRAIREENHARPSRASWWRERRRLVLPSGIVVGIAAAVAAALFLLPSSGGGPGSGVNLPGLGRVHVPGLGTGQAQAKAVLAHIARIAATTPASSVPSADQFLYTEWIDGYTGNEVHDGHNYRLTNGQTEQDWEAPDGSGRQLTSAGFFHLLTPVDNAEWLAAGSANDSGAAPGGGIMDAGYPKGAYFNNCGMLPTGPAGLSTDPKQLLRQIVAQYEKGSYSTSGTLDRALCILETSAYPPLRAATYRMIGELPDIESLGTVTDTLGRSGAAVAAPPDPNSGEQDVVILDSATGMPLEQEQIQANNDNNHKLYFTPAPKTEAQRQRDATIEAQQTLAVGTVVGYRVFVKSGVVDSDTALPGGGSVPYKRGITPQHTITCANAGSTTVGMTCTMPGAGTLQPGGVTCQTASIVTTPLPPGSTSPTRVVCPAGATSGTTPGVSTDATTTGATTGAETDTTAVTGDTTTG
jgi:hypothetical protein